jgi:hypothetical protein
MCRVYHCVRGGIVILTAVLVVALDAFTDEKLLAAYALFAVSMLATDEPRHGHTV